MHWTRVASSAGLSVVVVVAVLDSEGHLRPEAAPVTAAFAAILVFLFCGVVYRASDIGASGFGRSFWRFPEDRSWMWRAILCGYLVSRDESREDP